MKRRSFLGKLGWGTALTGAALFSACKSNDPQSTPTATAKAVKASSFKWKMVTTWPQNFPGLGTGANYLAETIQEMSNGRIEIKVYGAGELVPAFEIFDAVSRGTAQMGHGAAYYWKGKAAAAQFFAAIPFGLTAQEMNAWLYHGGGMALWEKLYSEFNLIPLAAGNSGVQMAGWFNKEINTVNDLKGLKMRIPGLGGEVLKRAGGTPVNLPGAEIFTSLQSGALDATEWVGPYNDLAFGLHKAAKYYYYPGWHEPGTTIECFINQQAYAGLPADLQAIVKFACHAANQNMLAEYTARNNAALQTLINEHQVQVRALPTDVLQKLRLLSDEVVKEIAAKDPYSKQVYASFIEFKEHVVNWQRISEQAFLNARTS